MSVFVEDRFKGIDFDLFTPRIGYQRLGQDNATASSETPGFAASNAANVRTDSAWRPTSLPGSAANWGILFGAATAVSYFGVAAHDLFTQNATVALEITVDAGSTWTAIAGLDAIVPTENDPILFLFDEAEVDGIRLRIVSADDNPTIATMGTGPVMEWPRRAVWSGTPITEGDNITFNNNRSDTGNWLGRTRISDGLNFSIQIDNMSEAYRTSDFETFKRYANGENAAFWIASRPGNYPDEISYAWTTELVRMTRNRPNAQVTGSVTLNCRGYRQDI